MCVQATVGCCLQGPSDDSGSEGIHDILQVHCTHVSIWTSCAKWINQWSNEMAMLIGQMASHGLPSGVVSRSWSRRGACAKKRNIFDALLCFNGAVWGIIVQLKSGCSLLLKFREKITNLAPGSRFQSNWWFPVLVLLARLLVPLCLCASGLWLWVSGLLMAQ